MDLLHQDELAKLWTNRPGIHASLFMKLEVEPDKQAKNRIKLKNLLSTLEKQLACRAGEQHQKAIMALIPDPSRLVGNSRAGQQPGRGLALFLHPEFQQTFHLPFAPAKQVVVDHRFYLRPLLPLVNDRVSFYFLSLSQKQVQLWQGDRFQFRPVDVPDMPESLEEALALEDPERQLQFHTASGGGDNRPAMFFGHDQESEKKGALLRYFQQVDKAVSSYLSGKNNPLFLGGVDYLLAIYATANSYPHLQDEGVTGNLDQHQPAELHRPVWELAATLWRAERHAAWQQFMDLQNSARSAALLADVVPAAAYGRVQTLFTVSGREAWGAFDPETGRVSPAVNGDQATATANGSRPDTAGDNPDHQALVNLAVIETLRQGGTVHAFADDDLADKNSFFADPLAAILRY